MEDGTFKGSALEPYISYKSVSANSSTCGAGSAVLVSTLPDCNTANADCNLATLLSSPEISASAKSIFNCAILSATGSEALPDLAGATYSTPSACALALLLSSFTKL